MRSVIGGTLVLMVICGVGCGSDATHEPHTGWWAYVDGGLVDNSCGRDDVYRDPDLLFWLTNHFNGTFTIAQGDNEDFTCTIDGEDFVCPQRLSDSQPVDGYDAVVHYHVQVMGTFSSRSAMTGTQVFDVSCEGTDCELAPLAGLTLPCTYTVAFTASKE